MMDQYKIDVITKSPVVVVIDTETTGLKTLDTGTSLIEIGAVKINVDTKKYSRFSTLIYPLYGCLSPKAEEINHIHWDDVKNAPQLESAMLSFADFIQDYPCVMHNKGFDWTRFLEPGLRRVGIIPSNSVLDTVEMMKYLHPNLGNYKLSGMTAFYGHPIPENEHHRAYVDAEYTASSYVRMYQEFKQLPANYTQKSLSDIVVKAPQFDMKNFRIFQVIPWSKNRENRIYVKTTAGEFCYDLNRKSWFVSNLSEYQVDLKACAAAILNLCHVTSPENLCKERMAA